MVTSFAKMLAEGRSQKGITLRKLSQLVGLSPSFLSDMENDRRNPTKDVSKIKDIALILGIDEQQFINAARIARMKNGKKIFDRLINTDHELAWGFCRAVEESSDDELQSALKNFLKSLKHERGG